MAEYHFIYKDVEGSSTQWDDIQRKLGNLPPAFIPDPFTSAEDEDSKSKNDLDDDPFFQEYSSSLLFLKETEVVSIDEASCEHRKARFSITDFWIDFVREVSHAPTDVWVFVVLYKDGHPECGVMQCMKELAAMYPATKFVKIVSTNRIPEYPDRNLLTVLVYNNSVVKANYVGLHTFGRRCTPEG